MVTAPETSAEYVVRIFGGVDRLAALVGRDRSRVYRWLQHGIKGGPVGSLPGAAKDEIVALAKREGIELDYSKLFQETDD